MKNHNTLFFAMACIFLLLFLEFLYDINKIVDLERIGMQTQQQQNKQKQTKKHNYNSNTTTTQEIE